MGQFLKPAFESQSRKSFNMEQSAETALKFGWKSVKNLLIRRRQGNATEGSSYKVLLQGTTQSQKVKAHLEY